MSVIRPALRWHGGKWMLAPWLISLFPPHRIYVEPFGGAASVLLRKPRAYAEVYNDLDHEVVCLFRVLRDPVAAATLLEQLRLTPYARAEFDAAHESQACDIERARAIVIRSFMGFSSDGATCEIRTGFRADSNRSGSTPAHDWMALPAALELVAERLKGVVIECRPAGKVMLAHDSPETLHYVDPPYLPSTRRLKLGRGGVAYKKYRHEMSEADHLALIDRLRALKGFVLLSGYGSALYDEALNGWTRLEKSTHADGASPRQECVWLNPRAAQISAHGPLFAGGAA